MLEQLIQIFLMDSYLVVSVEEGKEIKSYPIYLLHLYREKSLWQIEGFDLEEEKRRIIPVDNLTDVKLYPEKKRISKKKIVEQLSKDEEAINLVLGLGPKAIAQFKKYHPLNISISYTNPYQTTAVLKTFINVHHAEDLAEITNWLLFLGGDIKVMEVPKEVLEGFLERMDVLANS
ncbi:WYL domain-containing protein [Paenibacillus psychroresistens]|uniref:WYL domain-containing protein n=1 Tax=Paenibacillus psychroresistens TaxID=1778678 RepID=A0A6B8RUZ8_9BACL|nr:WYL domain-containing protein [Paenibacillus psychroresistens]